MYDYQRVDGHLREAATFSTNSKATISEAKMRAVIASGNGNMPAPWGLEISQKLLMAADDQNRAHGPCMVREMKSGDQG